MNLGPVLMNQLATELSNNAQSLNDVINDSS